MGIAETERDARVGGGRMLGRLMRDAHVMTPDQLGPLVAKHAARAGLHDSAIYAVDLRQVLLVPLPGQPAAHAQPLRVDGTLPGRAYRNIETYDVPESGGRRRLWLPLLDGTERLGVLGVSVEDTDEVIAEAARATAVDLAALVALLLMSKRAFSDTFAALVRTEPMQLPAEVQWTLLPPLTCATQRVVISAMLEPAYEVGGDAFDYGFSGDSVHLSIFDAMGHDLSAGLTATIAMGACRNTRRQRGGLEWLGEEIDAAVQSQFDGDRFVTGVLSTLDTVTGRLTWACWGHPAPLIVRHGGVFALTCDPVPPLGAGLGIQPRVCRYDLQPGDRVLFYTDGITEARNSTGELFGVERLADLVARRDTDELPAPETLRRLVHSVLEHQVDRLQDDATVLLVEWRGAAA
jgi:serine phosphatase RsbU (regulator of sigma subunit)